MDKSAAANQIHCVTNFQDLVGTSFNGAVNALCWTRSLRGDFAEIVNRIELSENIAVVEPEHLHQLQLSAEGQLARHILINDWQLLKAHGASPTLNVIRHYDRDEALPFLATDVYSFHVDRSPIPTDTFLCTYYGEPSELLPNAQGTQKVLMPDIRAQLKQLFDGAEEDFECFLTDNYFDLHYQPIAGAQPINLGLGNMWRLAVDHPQSKVLPCIHRAPKEKEGEKRLLMIC